MLTDSAQLEAEARGPAPSSRSHARAPVFGPPAEVPPAAVTRARSRRLGDVALAAGDGGRWVHVPG